MLDTKALAEATALVVKQHVAAAIEPLMKRIADLEARAPLHGKDGRDGVDGRDGSSVTLADVAPLVDEAVAKAVSTIPAPRDGVDGRDGADGKAVTVEDVAPLISDLVAKVVSDLPKPKDGTDGRDGKSVTVDDVAPFIAEGVSKAVAQIPAPRDGRDGIDGVDGKSVDVADIEPIIADYVARAVAAIPAPQDGKDGINGKDGRDGVDGAHGRDGRDGIDGKDGRDGADVTAGILDIDGNLVLTLSNGSTKAVGRVVGRDGKDGAPGAPGRDGKDGFDLKNLDAELLPNGRTLLLKFEDGTDTSLAVELGIPAMIYRGVWRDGEYQKGDTVTFGGSLWHSNEDGNTNKPDDGTPAWTLAAKRGRDGREAARL